MKHESHLARIGSTLLSEVLLLLSALEFACAFFFLLYVYLKAGWWSHPAIGGAIALTGLLVLAAVFGYLGFRFHTRPERASALLSKVAKRNVLIWTLIALVLALMMILAIIFKPEVISHTPLQPLQKHHALSFLALALVLQALWALASLKFGSLATPVTYLFQKYEQMKRSDSAAAPVSKFQLFERWWLTRNEFLSTSVVFFFLILLFFVPTLLQGKLPLSTSYLYQLSPWATYRGQFKNDMVVNNVLSDDYDSNIPIMRFAYTELLNGKFPSWLPYVNAGVPYGLLMFGVFSLHGLAILLAGAKWGTILYMCLKMYIAGISVYLYLRYRKFARTSALLGGIVLMFSPYIIVNGMSEVPDAIIYAPAILYFAERFVQERKYWQFISVVITVWVTCLSGFPSVIMYTLLLVAGYLAYRNLIELRGQSLQQRMGNLAILASAFLIAVLLLAFSLLPTYEFFKTVNIDYRIGRGAARLVGYKIGLLTNPNICGNPVHSAWVCDGNYNESALYVGLLPLMLIPFSLASKRYRLIAGFFLVAAALVLVIVFGVGSLNVIVGSLPLFNSNPNTRMISLLPLCFAFVSAAGIDGLTGTIGKKGYWALALYPLLGICTFWAFERISLASVTNTQFKEYYLNQRLFTTLLLLCYSIIVAGVLAFKNRSYIKVLLILVLLLNFMERSFLLGGYQGASYPGTFYPETAGTRFLESKMPNYERIVSLGAGFVPSFPLYFSINSLTGHAFADSAFKANLELISPGIYATNTTQPIFYPYSVDLASPLLDLYRVRYIVSSPSGDPVGWVALANQSEYNNSFILNDLKSFGQSLTIARDGEVDAIEVQVSTPTQRPISVNVEVLSENNLLVNFDGQLIRKNNGWYSIDLPALPVKQGQQISFEIAPDHESVPPDSRLLSVNFDIYHGGTMMLNGKERTKQGDLAFALLEYDAAIANKYKLVHTGDLNIYENTTLGNGIPVVSELRYSNQSSCASMLSQIDFSSEAIVGDKSITLANEGAAPQDQSPNASGNNLDSNARIREYAASNVVINTNTRRTSMVILSDTYYPGWQATVDGKETQIYRVDCDMRGVIVPPGEHVIRMDYNPLSFRIGLVISLCTLAGLACVYVIITLFTKGRGNRVVQ